MSNPHPIFMRLPHYPISHTFGFLSLECPSLSPGPIFLKAHPNTQAPSPGLCLLVQLTIHCLLGTFPDPWARLGIPAQSHIPLLSCITAHFTQHLCTTACISPWGQRNQIQHLHCKSSKVSRALKSKIKARGCLGSPEKRAVNSNFGGVGVIGM